MRLLLAAAAAATLLLAFPATTVALQQPYVGVVGCSNSKLIDESYLNVSARDVTWNSAQSGASLHVWASGSPFTSGKGAFDKQYGRYGATAVWYPLCIKVTDYAGTLDQQEALAWRDFLTFDALLRQRTNVQLWLTDTLGTQPSCTGVNTTVETYVVGRAVTDGYALQSSPDIPAASHPNSDNCHFDPLLSTNVGDAAVQFLDN